MILLKIKKTKKCTFLSFYYSKNKKRNIKNRKRCSKNKKKTEKIHHDMKKKKEKKERF